MSSSTILPNTGDANATSGAHASSDARCSFALDAIRLFWIFVLCSVAGFVIEEVYHLAVYHEVQDRSGLLVGPFSPIYGVGAIVLTFIGIKARRLPVPVLFLVSAAAGGAIEYTVSLGMELGFGIAAWDYTGTWLSIDGRTNGYLMLMWGFLGVIYVRFGMPLLDRACSHLQQIPRWPTRACVLFMTLNIALTLVSLNCWYHRQAGEELETPIQWVCASVMDDSFMAQRFQTMAIAPELSLRVKQEAMEVEL